MNTAAFKALSAIEQIELQERNDALLASLQPLLQILRGDADMTSPPQPAELERLALCVRCCNGINDGILKNWLNPPQMGKSYARVVAQREKLLAAAKNLRDVKGRHHSEIAMTRLIATITEIEAAL